MQKMAHISAARLLRIIGKLLLAAMLIAVMVIVATSISPIYDFAKPSPFSGPDIFNPYRNLDTTTMWQRANFHTHTRVEGPMNECELWPDEVYDQYMRYDYDIVTFSNHNELTAHPIDSLQVDLYEHGYNLLKFHKLVFGSREVDHFDHLLPIFASQRQWQIDRLQDDGDIVVLNHPLRTPLTTRSMLEKLTGYNIMELDSGRSTENEYWDWALSAGHYSFGMANDDLHYPDRSAAIAVRCNFLCTASARYKDIRATLLDGCYYSMRLPDYGEGNFYIKEQKNSEIPYITDIGLRGDTIHIALSQVAASIKVIGQNHTLLHEVNNTDHTEYTLGPNEPYARFIVYFEEGEVIYSNPFARYDASLSDTPYAVARHPINVWFTILYNLLLVALTIAIAWLLYRLVIKPIVYEHLAHKDQRANR